MSMISSMSLADGIRPMRGRRKHEERKHWRLIARGRGIHWEDLDEDISVAGLLAGRPSGESQASFKKWLAA
ncbi:MAG: DUF2442 domain-containing protein [Acidobacteria bacterium]|nr:DUF2442 domain-containing protein [Acidobacteriota bacterium]